MTAADLVLGLTRRIPDFPESGVLFEDLTPVLADGPALAAVADAMAAPFLGAFDVVAGIEARGFVLAAAIAARTASGIVLIRKAGKLPGPTHGTDYALEYGSGRLEVHVDQVAPGSRVLLVDDVLATGGTLAAAAELVERAGWGLAGLGVVLEILGLPGRARLAPREVHAIVSR